MQVIEQYNKWKLSLLLVDICCGVLIVLFLYTAISKIVGLKQFTATINQSQLLNGYGYVIAYLVPVIELIIVILLVTHSFRKVGLIASTVLLSIFTIYIVYMLLTSSKLPCSCGGVLQSLSWREHVFFNLSFIIVSILGQRGLVKYQKFLSHNPP